MICACTICPPASNAVNSFREEAHLVNAKYNKSKNTIEYNLNFPAYILMRAGIKNGMLYQILVNWEYRDAGVHKEEIKADRNTALKRMMQSEEIEITIFACPYKKDEILPKDIPLKITTNCKREQDVFIADKDIDVEINCNIPLGWASKKGMMVKAYLDGKLIKRHLVKSIPYKFSIKQVKLDKIGEYSLCVNLWNLKDNFGCGELIFKHENREAMQNAVNGLSSEKIAYIKRSKDGYYQIYLHSLDKAENKIQITSDSADKRTCEISPDGKSLVYTTNTGRIHLLTFNDIYNPMEIKTDVSNCSNAKWGPDGSFIIFTGYADVRNDDSDIWQYSLQEKKVKKLTDLAWLQNDAILSGDGKTIYFINGPECNKYEMFRMNLEDKTPIQITQKNGYIMEPTLSPDEGKIAYSFSTNGYYKIWVTDKNGENYKQITFGETQDELPSWEGDFSIYYLSKNGKTGKSSIMRLNTESLETKIVETTPEDIIWFSKR